MPIGYIFDINLKIETMEEIMFLNMIIVSITWQKIIALKSPLLQECMRQDGCIITIAFGIKAKEGRLLLRHCVCIELPEHYK